MGLIYLFIKNFFGGVSKAPGASQGYSPAVVPSDPMSLRVYITEAEYLASEDLEGPPVWELREFTLPLPAEQVAVVTYKPSEVRLGPHRASNTPCVITLSVFIGGPLLVHSLLEKPHLKNMQC